MVEHDDTKAVLRDVQHTMEPLLAEVRAVLGGGLDLAARLIVDAMPFPVWVKNDASMVLHINSAYAREFGVDPKQIIGVESDMALGPDMARQIREQDRAALEARELLVIDETHTEPARTVYKLAIPTPGGELLLWGCAFLKHAPQRRQDHLALRTLQAIQKRA